MISSGVGGGGGGGEGGLGEEGGKGYGKTGKGGEEHSYPQSQLSLLAGRACAQGTSGSGTHDLIG